jgi:uncharacterized protein
LSDTAITCENCKACCCRLEVILMGEDRVPARFVQQDPWGGEVMARLEDGFCAALDRATGRCTIYALRPGVCRDFAMGGDDCMTERAAFPVALVRQRGA